MATDSPPLPARLEGRRLVLRELTQADSGALWEAVEGSREALKRRLAWAGGALAEDDEARFIAESARGAGRGERAVWGVFESRASRGAASAEGPMAGIVSLEDLAAQERASARLGVWIRAERQDRGYAVEATRLVVEHAFRRLGLHRLYARLEPSNRAFRRVLKKLGFRYEGCLRDDKRLNGRWVDQECWGLLKAERKR